MGRGRDRRGGGLVVGEVSRAQGLRVGHVGGARRRNRVALNEYRSDWWTPARVEGALQGILRKGELGGGGVHGGVGGGGSGGHDHRGVVDRGGGDSGRGVLLARQDGPSA